MLFKLRHSQALLQGRLEIQGSGQPVLVDWSGGMYRPAEIDFVIADDDRQEAKVRATGLKVHTPMSVLLGVVG